MNARLLLVAALVLASCDARTITFATPTASATPFSTPLRTAVPTPTPTAPPTASPTPSRTPTPAPTASPAATAAATPSPGPSTTLPPGAALPAMPAAPALPAGATWVASGTSLFPIGAGQTRRFAPADLARERGAVAPPCASLVLVVAWRATEPLTGAWYPEGSTSAIEVGRGRWGTFDLGCASFELRNTGNTTVVGEIAYTIASR